MEAYTPLDPESLVYPAKPSIWTEIFGNPWTLTLAIVVAVVVLVFVAGLFSRH